jgi:hypothetical protein
MIKKIIFTLALLTLTVAPLTRHLAHGQTPTPNALFTDNVVSAGSDPTYPCDIGPPYTGSIPAQAQQAGFTHCAANYDFTQTQSFTDSLGTHQWSNLSSWFSCNNTTPYLFALNGVTLVPCDTSHQNITTDGGTQVLALTYTLADAQAGNYQNNLASGVSTNGTQFPNQFYVEHVIRPTTTSPCGSCLFYYLQTWVAGNGSNPCFIETDNEFSTTGWDVGMALWNAPCGTSSYYYDISSNPSSSTPISTSNYTTFGELLTADGLETVATCANLATGAVAGLPKTAFVGCGSWDLSSWPVNAPQAMSARMNLVLHEGPESAGQGGSGWTATSETTYFQRVTFWTCANYASGPCYTNPVITSGP